MTTGKRAICIAFAFSCIGIISGCGGKAGYFFSSFISPLEPARVHLNDGAETLSYSFVIGNAKEAETVLFFVPGSGCSSLKYYLKKYLEGLEGSFLVFGMQKRFVGHSTTGIFGCPDGFDEWNHFSQWVTDHDWYIRKTLAALPYKPKRVLLLGVSEGAYVASAVAARNAAVTHLAFIGHGGMKQIDELRLLVARRYLTVDPTVGFEAEFAKVLAESHSIDKRLFSQTYKYWTGQAFVDPLEFLLPLRIPIIVGFGEEDRSVPVESVRLLERRFQEAGKNNLSLRLYPGAGHTLVNKDGTDYRPVFLRSLSRWLLNETASGQPQIPPPTYGE